ncbi:MAG: CYTH domain-containing protein [Magnetococcales bacterium]|nr:CYTH domain-containing protein [Magnetococcales bacterium]
MAKEIERRFLVQKALWQAIGRPAACGFDAIRQGFLSTVKERVVRVRVVGERGILTIKGLTRGFSKVEFEYDIPLADAQSLLDELCEHPLIEKVRYRVEHGGVLWEVDEFSGENKGLLLAEVELADEQQPVELPVWVGQEVSSDVRYFNSNLSVMPFSRWGEVH